MSHGGISLTMLPVVQKWDCHTCGSCCREYRVTLSDDERAKVNALSQGMQDILNGRPAISSSGWWWNRIFFLTHSKNGSCIFLGDSGRCAIHEKFGYASKPLPCRLFPWVLVPQGNKWAVGVRFACPSAAQNKGRPIPAHTLELETFASELVQRENILPKQDGFWGESPSLDGYYPTPWDFFHVVRGILLEGIERASSTASGLVRCITWIELMRSTRGWHKLSLEAFKDLSQLLWEQAVRDCNIEDGREVTNPDWLSLLVFRQAAAVYTRKDHGPKQGIARTGIFARLSAILRFTWGSGKVPRLHDWVPDSDFKSGERADFSLAIESEQALLRYYKIKITSGQFAGTVHHRYSVWDGFASLAMTYPILCWITRLGAIGQEHANLIKALSIVDDHFGFNRVLGGFSHRFFLSVLQGNGRLKHLIRWYSPDRH